MCILPSSVWKIWEGVRFDTVFRVMTRTSMRYNAQIEAARMKEYQEARKKYDDRKKEAEEKQIMFEDTEPSLGRYMKSGDELFPVIPIVINLNPSSSWTASKDIFGTLKERYPLLMMFAPNFFYNLVNPKDMRPVLLSVPLSDCNESVREHNSGDVG